MTGTCHIAVAMKPIQGNFVSNALKHGVSGVNIDGTRIAGPKGSGVWGTSNKTINTDRKFNASPNMTEYRSQQHSAGRWPANLILGHHPDCRCLGEKKVKANREDTRPDGDAGRDDRTQWRFRPTDATKRGYADSDGTETVEDWDCHPDCVVMSLDRQSGVLTSGKPGWRRKPHETNAMSGRLAITGKQESGMGDSGGASRFFFQVGEIGANFERTNAQEGRPT